MKDKSILIAVIIFIIAISLFSCGSSKKEKEIVLETETEQKQEVFYAGVENYEVDCFETLSDIAVKYIPSDEYMNDWIADVKRLNGRKTNDIYFGEVIKVYYY